MYDTQGNKFVEIQASLLFLLLQLCIILTL